MSKREISEREFEAFYMAHWRRLVAALASSLPGEEDPADVAQEAFARAYANWKSVGSHDVPLQSHLAGLASRQKAALLLRYFYGLSTQETAQLLRCKEGTVKSLVARGKVAVSGAYSNMEVS